MPFGPKDFLRRARDLTGGMPDLSPLYDLAWSLSGGQDLENWGRDPLDARKAGYAGLALASFIPGFGAIPKASRLGILSPAARKAVVGANKFEIKPTAGFDPDKFVSRLPVAGRHPHHTGPSVQYLDQLPPDHLPQGVKGRIPWVVDPETGKVFVGRIDESHSDVRWKLEQLGYRPTERPLEGWATRATPEEKVGHLVTLAAKGLDTKAMPKNTKGITKLAHLLTHDVVDEDILLQGGVPISMAERQGSRADDLLGKLGGPMSKTEMRDYIQSLPANLREKYKKDFGLGARSSSKTKLATRLASRAYTTHENKNNEAFSKPEFKPRPKMKPPYQPAPKPPAPKPSRLRDYGGN